MPDHHFNLQAPHCDCPCLIAGRTAVARRTANTAARTATIAVPAKMRTGLARLIVESIVTSWPCCVQYQRNSSLKVVLPAGNPPYNGINLATYVAMAIYVQIAQRQTAKT